MTFTNPQAVIAAVRDRFAQRQVLVVGDLMLDRYLWGQVERISPEAPVPVVHLERTTESAGGAANVARNLAALGLKVSVGGMTGDDVGRTLLLRDLADSDIDTSAILCGTGRVTTIKTRVIGNRQQMIRVDDERTAPLPAADAERLLAAALPLLAKAGALVLSDYAKGVLTDEVCKELIQAAREEKVPVLVDPKGRDFGRYDGATLITPNRTELSIATGTPISDLKALLTAAGALREEIGLHWLILTLSEQGMAIIGPQGNRQIPAVGKEVFDVSGAGDTVIATFAAGLAAGLGCTDTAHLANLAAGVVVGKIGTASATWQELLAAIDGEAAIEQAAKVCDPSTAEAQIHRWKAVGEQVVFTNGCFDLLHVGHVTYLERARRYGHRLVVGLNTDASVRRLKGPARPLIRQDDRARVLAALASVDAVVPFDEDTPLALIEQLRPDVLAKGADYAEEQVVGASEVKSWGGRVVLVPLVEDRSTTGIIERMSDSGAEQNGG